MHSILQRWGIDPGYHDTVGNWRVTSPETRDSLLAAMGVAPGDSPADDAERVKVLSPGQTWALPRPGDLTLEDQTSIRVERELPPDLPLGYHRLRLEGDLQDVLVIQRPAACYSDPAMRIWGWAVQLYAVRSHRSWGLGDLGDLQRLAEWSGELGAGALLINPLSAAAPVLPQQTSPYFPSSRRFLNPLYLCVPEVPGAAEPGSESLQWSEEAERLSASRTIDRDRVFRLKIRVLEQLWERWPGEASFGAYCSQQGESLKTFATYCALAERHGGDWRRWPEAYRRPEAAAVERFAQQEQRRVGFHMWLQWLGDRQLAQAARAVPLVQDLPIGVDPGGADAWQWQDVLAQGATVGAPPDPFNADGQDWRLPPFIPHRLKEVGFGPFIETIRAALRHAGGLRIDHVMGLFRLFWIPAEAGPQAGAYVRYPAEELLAIVAVESHRAKAWVAGEDLGTVENHVRDRLRENQMLSYRLMWFEDGPPREYPPLSMAAITTHDLPTVAGLWSGADYAAQQQIGLRPSYEGYQQLRRRLQAAAGVGDDTPIEQVIQAGYRAMASAPSAVLVANLEDALAVEERPNMPGTVHQWPNWSIALPQLLEDFESAQLPREIARGLSRRSDV